MNIANLVFVGFNSRVAALDRKSGDIVWDWKAPTGSGYVSLLLDGEQLFVAVNGYTYCLDPARGDQVWFNKMSGFGFGVTSIATCNGHSDHTHLHHAAAADAAAAAQSASSTTVHG